MLHALAIVLILYSLPFMLLAAVGLIVGLIAAPIAGVQAVAAAFKAVVGWRPSSAKLRYIALQTLGLIVAFGTLPLVGWLVR